MNTWTKYFAKQINLAIVPSRTEGFGLTALEALSACLPFLVSQNSGFGEALSNVSNGLSCVVDSENPQHWAEAIKDVRHKSREIRYKECETFECIMMRNTAGKNSVLN